MPQTYGIPKVVVTLSCALIAALVLLPACTARESEWKISPDPEIVAFSINDAVSVTQELVPPPSFLHMIRLQTVPHES